MIAFEVEGKEYKAPENWSELTLGKYVEVNSIKEEDPYNYMRKFVMCLTGLSSEQSMKLVLNGNDGELGLEELFNYLSKFRTWADEENIKIEKQFKVNGKAYTTTPEVLSSLMKPVPMRGATFGEFEEASNVHKAMTGGKEMNLDMFPLLTAIIFREKVKDGIKPYNSDELHERVKVFKDHLTMDKAFSAYFFLSQQMILLEKDLKGYSKEMESLLSTAGGRSKLKLQKIKSTIKKGLTQSNQSSK